MNSSACSGNVYSCLSKSANILPARSRSYSAGKTERGETDFIVQGEAISPALERLFARKHASGSSSVTRPGDPFPGVDVCKDCPAILFKKEH